MWCSALKDEYRSNLECMADECKPQTSGRCMQYSPYTVAAKKTENVQKTLTMESNPNSGTSMHEK